MKQEIKGNEEKSKATIRGFTNALSAGISALQCGEISLQAAASRGIRLTHTCVRHIAPLAVVLVVINNNEDKSATQLRELRVHGKRAKLSYLDDPSATLGDGNHAAVFVNALPSSGDALPAN